MLLLISDASVLIDIEISDLTSAMFSLPFQFAVPDILFAEELAEHHGQLLHYGLLSKTLDSNLINEAVTFRQHNSKVSVNDLLALLLAKKEQCQLLTGDKALREVANKFCVEVHGTIWLVEKMITHEKITKDIANIAFQKMKERGSRIPWSEVETMLKMCS